LRQRPADRGIGEHLDHGVPAARCFRTTQTHLILNARFPLILAAVPRVDRVVWEIVQQAIEEYLARHAKDAKTS
jgi:hypothetical protein